MKLLWIFTVMILSAMASQQLRAEGGCPPGQFPQRGPGWQGCTPPPAYPPSARVRSEPSWISKWQALMADTKKGRTGIASGSATEQDAILSARRDCLAEGGENCRLLLTTKNGCVALATGTKPGITSGQGPSARETEALVLKTCEPAYGQCKLYYSNCDYAERVE